MPQRRQKRADDPKPQNQCPKIDDAASPEAQSDDSGEAQASKTLLFTEENDDLRGLLMVLLAGDCADGGGECGGGEGGDGGDDSDGGNAALD